MSDIHWEFDPPDILEVECDVLVLAGDVDVNGLQAAERALTLSAEVSAPVVLLAGNHEFYDTRPMDRTIEEMREAAARSDGRLTFLERDSAIVAGIRFVGCTLWSDFALAGEATAMAAREAAERQINDFNMITYRERLAFSTYYALAEFKLAKDFLRRELAKPSELPTVVVTHHAPSARSVHPRFAGDLLSGSFASDLDDLVAGSGAELWIHGHMHDSFDYLVGETRVLCNPRGYVRVPDGPAENTAFDPGLVVEVGAPAPAPGQGRVT
jgi:Icc-related predicted phosphoesterase